MLQDSGSRAERKQNGKRKQQQAAYMHTYGTGTAACNTNNACCYSSANKYRCRQLVKVAALGDPHCYMHCQYLARYCTACLCSIFHQQL